MPRKNTRATIRGLSILLRNLERDMKDPIYSHFKIKHDHHVGLPYPPNHELLELDVCFNPQDGTRHYNSYSLLRPHRSSKWYKEKNYKKVGKPVTLRKK